MREGEQTGLVELDELVVVLEDDVTVAALLAAVLARGGFEVVRATTGAQTLGWLRQRRAALLVMGSSLTLSAARSFLRSLQRLAPQYSPPVLALLVPAQVRVRTKLERLGIDDFVVEPFTPEELIRRARHMVDGGQFEETNCQYSIVRPS